MFVTPCGWNQGIIRPWFNLRHMHLEQFRISQCIPTMRNIQHARSNTGNNKSLACLAAIDVECRLQHFGERASAKGNVYMFVCGIFLSDSPRGSCADAILESYQRFVDLAGFCHPFCRMMSYICTCFTASKIDEEEYSFWCSFAFCVDDS
jgi:hypothetical protein